MANLPGRMGTLVARDIMTAKVITVSEQDTLEEALDMLRRHHITGAPVVDEQRRLVGILSVIDLVGRKVETPSPRPATPLAHGTDPVTWDLFDRARALAPDVGAEKVSNRMSRQVTSVTADAPLVEVARAMCDGHWHRVPVVDEGGGLAGIITTMDVLATLVNSADEPR